MKYWSFSYCLQVSKTRLDVDINTAALNKNPKIVAPDDLRAIAIDFFHLIKKIMGKGFIVFYSIEGQVEGMIDLCDDVVWIPVMAVVECNS